MPVRSTPETRPGLPRSSRSLRSARRHIWHVEQESIPDNQWPRTPSGPEGTLQAVFRHVQRGTPPPLRVRGRGHWDRRNIRAAPRRCSLSLRYSFRRERRCMHRGGSRASLWLGRIHTESDSHPRVDNLRRRWRPHGRRPLLHPSGWLRLQWAPVNWIFRSSQVGAPLPRGNATSRSCQ